MVALSHQIEDRLHGIFVVLLCSSSICEHFFHESVWLCDALIIATAAYGIFFVIFSIPHVHKMVLKKLQKKKEKSEQSQ